MNQPRFRSQNRWVGWKPTAAFCLLLAAQSAADFTVSGWLVYEDPASYADFEKNAPLVDRVYADWYRLGPGGLQAHAGPAEKSKTLECARQNEVEVFSMASNLEPGGGHDGDRVREFLYSPALRKKHVSQLVANAVKDGAAGIDIGYENLKAADAQPFATFIRELREACARKSLLLSASLTPKFAEPGTWEGARAHDYLALAPHLHIMRPMTFDEHWGSSSAGPISSPEFTELSIAHSLSASAASKIELCLAGYGYDWDGNKGTQLSWAGLKELQSRTGLKMERDPETQELKGTYEQEGRRREVWYCDAASYLPKYEILKKRGLAGIALWRFGTEDPAFWQDLKKLKSASRP